MTTSLPFRLMIQHRLTDALKQITPGNGYVSDLSDLDGKARVVRGRGLFGADDPLPMVSILQPPHPVDPLESPMDSTDLKLDFVLIIQGWVDDDPINPTDPAEVLMADVRKRIAKLKEEGARPPNLLGLGGPSSPDTKGTDNSVGNLTVGWGVVRPPDQTTSKAYFWMLLIVNITENLSKPYGQ